MNERAEGFRDRRPIALRLRQPGGMIANMLVPGGAELDCDERLWVPQSEGIWFRPVAFAPERGSYVNYLRVRGAGVLSRHRHNGGVPAFRFRGTWRYLEHDWLSNAGDYAFEPPGETHTLVIPDGVGETLTLFFVSGGHVYVDPDGQTMGYEDVFTKMASSHAHHESVGMGGDYVDGLVIGR